MVLIFLSEIGSLVHGLRIWLSLNEWVSGLVVRRTCEGNRPPSTHRTWSTCNHHEQPSHSHNDSRLTAALYHGGCASELSSAANSAAIVSDTDSSASQQTQFWPALTSSPVAAVSITRRSPGRARTAILFKEMWHNQNTSNQESKTIINQSRQQQPKK